MWALGNVKEDICYHLNGHELAAMKTELVRSQRVYDKYWPKLSFIILYDGPPLITKLFVWKCGLRKSMHETAWPSRL